MSSETANTIRHAADVTQWGALGIIVAVLAVILLAGYRWPEWRRVLALPLPGLLLRVLEGPPEAPPAGYVLVYAEVEAGTVYLRAQDDAGTVKTLESWV